MEQRAQKPSKVFEQLIYAMIEAEKRAGTTIQSALTTTTKFSRTGASIEVLFPPPTLAVSGVGGYDVSGNKLKSNSLSVAIRVVLSPNASVLLGGDIEFGCLDEWRKQNICPQAHVLVFPHHGGLPGDGSDADAALFAYELAKLVQPNTVVFSIHRTQFGLPRNEVVSAISKALNTVQFACTQLPSRFHTVVPTDPAWSLHRDVAASGYRDGSIEMQVDESGLIFQFIGSP